MIQLTGRDLDGACARAIGWLPSIAANGVIYGPPCYTTNAALLDKMLTWLQERGDLASSIEMVSSKRSEWVWSAAAGSRAKTIRVFGDTIYEAIASLVVAVAAAENKTGAP